MKLKTLSKVMILAGLLSVASFAQATDDERIEKLEQQLKAMQAEINRLKAESDAQKTPTSSKETNVSDLKNEIDQLNKTAVVLGDQPGSFRLPGSETSVRIYGYVGAHMIHDIKSASDDIYTDIPFQSTDPKAQKNITRITAKDSRFGFETSTPTQYGSFTTKFEGDFANGSDDNGGRFRLRHGYGEYAGFLIGQTWSTWMDLDNTPETVDFNGPIGTPFRRTPMIRYTYDMPSVAKFTVALEDTADSTVKRPNIVARIDKSFERGSVNVRAMSSSLNTGNKNYTGSGWGIGGNYKLTDSILAMAQYTQLKGGDMGSGWSLLGSNKGVYEDGAGQSARNKSTGWLAGLTYTINDFWRANVVYSETRNKEIQEYLDFAAAAGDTLNKKATQYHLNVIYTPIKKVDLGLEYIGGKRTTFDAVDNEGKMSRFDFMGKYSF